jgi:COP9 signalosome complex subunit 1
MAVNAEQSAFFQHRLATGELVVREPPKFDLDSYLANYTGFTRIDRLHHIGTLSPYLAPDAYRLAIAEAKRGKNVGVYTALVEDFSAIAPQDPAALLDTAWAERKTREKQQEQERLEHELKSYKNNLIKESIRVRARGSKRTHTLADSGRWATRTSATSSTTRATTTAHSAPTPRCASTAPRTSTWPT